MFVSVSDTYEALSKRAASDLIEFVRSIEEPLICTASGDSPAGLYKEIVESVRNKEADISNWNFVGLDEWAGMNGNDEGSCQYHLNRQFFHPLQIAEERICFFDGRAKNLDEECELTEAYILQHDGIDVAILGLGMNGHIGMNEPGTSAQLRAHIADIDPQTQAVGQKYFSSPQTLTHGLTVGIATLMTAKRIMLIVSGEKKAEIVHRMLTEEISEQLPATILRTHPGLRLYLDKAAAALSF